MPELNLIDIILIVVIAAVVITAAAVIIRRKKKGGGCSCGCAGCPYSGSCARSGKER